MNCFTDLFQHRVEYWHSRNYSYTPEILLECVRAAQSTDLDRLEVSRKYYAEANVTPAMDKLHIGCCCYPDFQVYFQRRQDRAGLRSIKLPQSIQRLLKTLYYYQCPARKK